MHSSIPNNSEVFLFIPVSRNRRICVLSIVVLKNNPVLRKQLKKNFRKNESYMETRCDFLCDDYVTYIYVLGQAIDAFGVGRVVASGHPWF